MTRGKDDTTVAEQSTTLRDEAPTVDAKGGSRRPGMHVDGDATEVRPLGATGYRGRYVIGEPLGQGGMGEVLLAHDTQIGRQVAVKRLLREHATPEAHWRFMREAQIQGTLEHPAVVPVHELGTDEDGQPYMVMKRLVGITLAQVLERLVAGDADAQRKYPRTRLLRVFVEVCRAIEFAHHHGVIHRDLKPSNIMLGELHEVYVLDWGIARRLDPGTAVDASPLETAMHTMMGTPGYMPPEQIDDAASVTERADVYALGCILFEVLAGERLHPSGSAGITSAASRVDARPSRRAPTRDIPPELDEACVRATAFDPAQRPTAHELAALVEQYLDGDRDLALRNELARVHLARARQAMAAGDSEDVRREAMREAGRAVALDPRSEAAAFVGRLMLEPPRSSALHEVERQLDADDDGALRSHARFIALASVTYLAFVPFLPWMGVGDSYMAAAVGLSLLLAMVSWTLTRTRHVSVALVIAVVIQASFIALCARMFSPFLIAPGLASVTVMLLAIHLRRLAPTLALSAVCALAVIGPWLLEEVGLLSSTMQGVGANLVLQSEAVGMWMPAATFGLPLALIALLMNTVYLTRSVVRWRRELQRSLRIQEWHLRQLVDGV